MPAIRHCDLYDTKVAIRQTCNRESACCRQQASDLVFAVLSAIFLSLFLPFLFYWFIPTFNISIWFGALIMASSVTQYASALIPEVEGWKTRWHRLLASITGLSLIPALVILLLTDTVSLNGKITTGISLGVMIVIATLLLRRDGKHDYFLVLEFCYFGAFFVPILFIAYT